MYEVISRVNPASHFHFFSFCCYVFCLFSSQVVPLLGRFSDIRHLLPDSDNKFDAVLFDVGMSSMQADTAERGFSVSCDGPLDMRFDGDRYLQLLLDSVVLFLCFYTLYFLTVYFCVCTYMYRVLPL